MRIYRITPKSKAAKLIDAASGAADWAEKGIKIYNTAAKIHNSTSDKNSQWPTIDGKPLKDHSEENRKQKINDIIKRGNSKEIAKNLNNMYGKEVENAIESVNAKDKWKKNESRRAREAFERSYPEAEYEKVQPKVTTWEDEEKKRNKSTFRDSEGNIYYHYG